MNLKLKPTKNQAGKWQCKTCMLRMDENMKTCVACNTNRPGKIVQECPISASSAGDKWECTVCMLINKNSDKICAACQSPSQGEIVPILPLKVNNEWECPACLLRNKSVLPKCAACDSVKPENKIKDLSKMFTEEKWDCTTCMLRNDVDREICVACSTPKENETLLIHGKSATTVASQSVNDVSRNCTVSPREPEQTITAKNLQKWECSGCLLQNNQLDDFCPACQKAKPQLNSQSNKLLSNENLGTKKRVGR